MLSKERTDQRAAIKNIAGCQWRPDCKMWSVPDTEENRAAIRQIHQILPPAAGTQQCDGVPVSQPINPHPDILRPDNAIGISPCPGNQDFLSLHLPPGLVPQHLATVKNIHGRRWNPEQKTWEIPYTKLTFRFVWRTIKSYKNCFRQFIKHYDNIKPSQITRQQINDYLTSLIRERHISAAHQSQIMSAIKMFYAAVIDQEEKIRNLFQPKPPKKLPQVFLKEEVTALQIAKSG